MVLNHDGREENIKNRVRALRESLAAVKLSQWENRIIHVALVTYQDLSKGRPEPCGRGQQEVIGGHISEQDTHAIFLLERPVRC